MPFQISDEFSPLWPFLHATGAADAVFWTDPQLTRFMADSIRRLCQKYQIDVLRDASTVVLVQGQATYATPPDHLATMHVALSGKPLIPTSTAVLERLDPAYQTTQGTPKRWYTDRVGNDVIGFYPVPDGPSAGKSPEIIFQSWPCAPDEAHTINTINLQRWVQDWLLLKTLEQAFAAESDGRQVESSQGSAAMAGVFEQQIASLWGGAQ